MTQRRTRQNIVRISDEPREHLPETPLWIQRFLDSTPARESFLDDLDAGIARCSKMFTDAFRKDDPKNAAIALGKRDALEELKQLLKAYDREEREQNAIRDEKREEDV